MKVLPDGLAALLGVAPAAALLGVAPADGVGEAAVVAGADGVGESAAVAGAALVGVLAVTFPACDGSPQPATTTSRVADTALANVKRHLRRGCGAGIARALLRSCQSIRRPSVVRQPGKVADPRGLF